MSPACRTRCLAKAATPSFNKARLQAVRLGGTGPVPMALPSKAMSAK